VRFVGTSRRTIRTEGSDDHPWRLTAMTCPADSSRGGGDTDSGRRDPRANAYSAAFVSPAVWILLGAAAVFAVVDWWAVAGELRRGVEVWAKPATMALLCVVAAIAGSPEPGVRAALVIGAALGLVGDVVIGESEPRFLGGLVAFLLGHIAYVIAALLVGFDWRWALVGVAFMAVLLGNRFLTRVVPGAVAIGGRFLGGAVVVYGAVIATMAVTAWGAAGAGSPAWLAGVGACSFAVSDWVLGHTRFAGPLPGGSLTIMTTYHVGQALLILGLALA